MSTGRGTLILLRPDRCTFDTGCLPAPLIERTAPMILGLAVLRGGAKE